MRPWLHLCCPSLPFCSSAPELAFKAQLQLILSPDTTADHPRPWRFPSSLSKRTARHRPFLISALVFSLPSLPEPTCKLGISTPRKDSPWGRRSLRNSRDSVLPVTLVATSVLMTRFLACPHNSDDSRYFQSLSTCLTCVFPFHSENNFNISFPFYRGSGSTEKVSSLPPFRGENTDPPLHVEVASSWKTVLHRF